MRDYQRLTKLTAEEQRSTEESHCENGDMKKQVEDELGFEIPEEQYHCSEERAKRKLSYIISRFGDSQGARREPEYLIELIFEDVILDILSKTSIFIATNMLDMEKEHSTICRSALTE